VLTPFAPQSYTVIIPSTDQSRIVDRRYLPIFAIVLVNFIGATIVIPVLPLFTQQHFGVPPQVNSLLYASFFIAQFVASPILGRLSDQYGRLPVLLISQLGTALSFLLMGTTESLVIMFAARILDGITGGNVIVAQAYLTDITTPKERTRALGLTWAAYGIGLTLGSVIGGLVAAAFGERAPFFVGAIMSLITVTMTYFLLDETLTPDLRAQRRSAGTNKLAWREVLSNTPLLLMLVIGFLGQLAMMYLQSTFSLYAEAVLFPTYEVKDVTFWAGVLLALHGIWQFLTQFLLIRRLLERFGERRLLIIGLLLRAVSLFVFVALPFPATVGLLGLVGFAIGSGIMMPSLQSLATTSSREQVSGAVLGVYQSATSLGIITGAVSSGFLFAQSPFLPYAVGSLILLITLLPASVLLRRGAQPALVTP
jgi:MFS transporter, DHA1 family, tetracycline resistance protein